MPAGTIKVITLRERQTAKVSISPEKGFDIGAGPGRELDTEVEGGVVGIILDARGKPLALPEDVEARIAKLREWNRALDAYPELAYERKG